MAVSCHSRRCFNCVLGDAVLLQGGVILGRRMEAVLPEFAEQRIGFAAGALGIAARFQFLPDEILVHQAFGGRAARRGPRSSGSLLMNSVRRRSSSTRFP